jgi:zinc transport system substrate-binding protein
MRRASPIALAVFLAMMAPGARAGSAPNVVVSIKPVHSLVAAVMAGVGEPGLIVAGGTSPHLYTLRPSDAERLQAADLVFWIGPIFDGFLAQPLSALAGKADVVELDRAPELALLPARQGGAWDVDAEAHSHGAASSPLEQDGHLWLDPDNARAIVHIAAARLSAHDSANAARYAANAAALERRLDALDGALRERLVPMRGVPFVVFHDAYQYFERRYGLDAIGSITVDPERPPGARRLQEIRAKVKALGARCVFSEPQFEPRLIQTVIAGTRANTAVLDPEGTALRRGPDLYFTLMGGLGEGLASCLARQG